MRAQDPEVCDNGEDDDTTVEGSGRSAESSRIGKAVEHLVAASCILASDLKLNVSTAFVDDEGVDLVFHRRGGSATLAVQVKSRSTDASVVRRGQFIGNVRTVTFRPRPDLWMLFVVIDRPTAKLGTVWLVPSVDFELLANRLRGGTIQRITASLKPTSNDKWRPYRLDFPELPGRILDALGQMGG